MDVNPYEAPQTESLLLEDPRNRLASIARRRNIVRACVALQLMLVGAQVLFQLRFGWWQLLALTMLLVMCAGPIFVFLLSKRIEGIGYAIVQAMLAFLPCLGLFVMLNVSAKAAKVLRESREAGKDPHSST